MFTKSDGFRNKGVSLGILSFYELGDHMKAPHFSRFAVASSDRNVRGLAQMLLCKLMRTYPNEMKEYLLQLAESRDANIRRLDGETLQPVQEIRRLYGKPEYPLSILRKMFGESSPYPRTSVGSNLSDLSKGLPELVCNIGEELVESGDGGSFDSLSGVQESCERRALWGAASFKGG